MAAWVGDNKDGLETSRRLRTHDYSKDDAGPVLPAGEVKIAPAQIKVIVEYDGENEVDELEQQTHRFAVYLKPKSVTFYTCG
jgi:hypothetical protein